MIIKVCGMNTIENLRLIAESSIDWIGFNFYPKSKRFIPFMKDCPLAKWKHPNIKKVGVFVNEEIENVKSIVDRFGLDFVQLHGGESAEYCQRVSSFCKVIKVFSVSSTFDFSKLDAFDFCEYFLFDTATPYFGGSGEKYDWDILKEYKLKIPFLLSGGLGPEDAEGLLNFKHHAYVGIDINSRFEISPGRKDREKVFSFSKFLKNNV